MRELVFLIPNFPIDAMESNLCSVFWTLSIISIPTALLNLYEKNSSKQQKTFSTVKTQHYTICGTAVLAIKSDFLGKQIFNCSFVKERYELK